MGKIISVGGNFFMQPKLTAKELECISDLLTLEENVCKKARAYSKTANGVLLNELNLVAENHEKRFNALLGLLK